MMESFIRSCERYLQYPLNLIDQDALDHILKAHSERLVSQKDRIFHEKQAAVDFLDFDSEDEEFHPSCVTTLDELKMLLRQALRPGSSDPQCRYIFLHAPRSRAPLRVSLDILTFLFSYHQVFSSFLDFIYPFGEQIDVQDFFFSGFREETRLDGERIGTKVLELDRSGRDIRICYNLRSVEPSNGQDDVPWSIRQAAVYHSLDLDTGKVVWINVKGNELIKSRITESSTVAPLAKVESASEMFSRSLATHLLLCDWSVENWLWYINDLEERVQAHSRNASATPLDKPQSHAASQVPLETTQLTPKDIVTSPSTTPKIRRSSNLPSRSEPVSPIYPSRSTTLAEFPQPPVTAPDSSYCDNEQASARSTDIKSSRSSSYSRYKWVEALRVHSLWRPSNPVEQLSEVDEKQQASSPTLGRPLTSPALPPSVLGDDRNIPRGAIIINGLQKFQYIEEKAQEALHVLQLNESVLEELRQHYEYVKTHAEFPEELISNCQAELRRFDHSIRSVVKDLRMLQTRLGALLRQLIDRKNLASASVWEYTAVRTDLEPLLLGSDIANTLTSGATSSSNSEATFPIALSDPHISEAFSSTHPTSAQDDVGVEIDLDLRVRPSDSEEDQLAINSQPLPTQENDDDIRSVRSIQDEDEYEEVQSYFTKDQWRKEVINGIIVVLAKNDGLIPLYEKGLLLMPSDRFVNNFRRLLKAFRRDLLELPWNREIHEVASVLRSEHTQWTIAQKVSERQVSPGNLLNNEDVARFQGSDETTLTKLERIFGRGKIPPPPPSIPAPRPSDALTDSDSDSNDDQEEAPSRSEMSQRPRVDHVIHTLVEGQPFRNLVAGLQDFLLPPGLLHDILSIPRDRVSFDLRNHLNFLDKLQGWIEDVTGVEWEWWPLRPRMHPLLDGKARVRWRCFCGVYRWRELNLAQKDVLEDILKQRPKRSTRLPLCALLKNNCQCVRANEAQSGCNPGAGAQLQNGLIQENSDTPAGVAPSPSVIIDSSSQSSDKSDARQMSVRAQTTINNVTSRNSYQQKKPLWLMFGVEGARDTPEWDQVGDEKLESDLIFLRHLKRKHHEMRGWIRLYFSFWQLNYWDFVKFQRSIVQPGRVSVEEIALPNSPEYEYNREPPGLSRHDFEALVKSCITSCRFSSLHCCNPIEKDLGVIGYLPKRNCEFRIKEKYPSDKEVWGIQARYLPSAIRIFLFHVALLPGSVGFWVWWQRRHPDDIQGASVPFFIIGTLVAAFWTTATIIKSMR